jgi:competence protein ComEA
MPVAPRDTATHPSRATRVAASLVILLAAGSGLWVTGSGPGGPWAGPSADPTPVTSARINVNTATAAELELLPRIGPALAARIVEDRERNGPFQTIDALDRVRGIGPRTVRNVRSHATAE